MQEGFSRDHTRQTWKVRVHGPFLLSLYRFWKLRPRARAGLPKVSGPLRSWNSMGIPTWALSAKWIQRLPARPGPQHSLGSPTQPRAPGQKDHRPRPLLPFHQLGAGVRSRRGPGVWPGRRTAATPAQSTCHTPHSQQPRPRTRAPWSSCAEVTVAACGVGPAAGVTSGRRCACGQGPPGACGDAEGAGPQHRSHRPVYTSLREDAD